MFTSSSSLSALRLPFDRLRLAWRLRVAAALLLVLQGAAWAQAPAQPGNLADPPGRVGRLNLIEGRVSFAPGDGSGPLDANAWTAAALNRPLTTGDRLWAGPRSRAELHLGSTTARINEETSLDFLTLDDELTQLRLAQGTLKLRVRSLFEGQRLEVDTPNLAFVISEPGDYRLDADPASDTTRVVAQAGSGVIYGDSGTPLNLGRQQQGSFSGTNLTPAAPGASVQDGFDAWALGRDQREDRSQAARFVPRETVGYQQLDGYGDWRQDPGYGAVWLPRGLPVNWAPYSVGHWSWIAPWGWTWIDDAPWGFAPFHYGRWAQIGPRWAWVPGRLGPRPVYAPALVAFVGGGDAGFSWNLSLGSGRPAQPSVGWFPLAPGEAFRPHYRASPRYVSQVNNTTVINNIVINNGVNAGNRPANFYRYQRQPAAVTAVPMADFARGQPVRGSRQPLNAGDLQRAQLIGASVVAGAAEGAGTRSALPPRPDRREAARSAPAAALPPPALLSARPVVGSRGELRQAQGQGPQEHRGNPVAQAPAARSPLPAAIPVLPANPAVNAPPATPTPPASPAAANQARREQALQRAQGRAPRSAPAAPDAQREPPPKAAAVTPPNPAPPVNPAGVNSAASVDARIASERAAAEQAQRATLRAQEQAQQRTQRDSAQQAQQAQQAQKAQQEQARQQHEVAQQAQQVQKTQQEQARQQQRAQKEQARQQGVAAQQAQQAQKPQQEQARQQRELAQQAQQMQKAQQEQARQQQRAQQDQQRQAREQAQRQQQEQRTQQAHERQQARRTDAATAREPQTEGGANRNKE